MPRDGQGIYSRAPGTEAAPNTTITSNQFNATIADLEQDANTARPITAGGTGATSKAAAQTALEITPAASATNDFTAGKTMLNGAGGLLGTALPLGVTNLNDVLSGHAWWVGSTVGVSNTPTSTQGILVFQNAASGRHRQTYYALSISGDEQGAYTRIFNTNGWRPWRRVIQAGDNGLGGDAPSVTSWDALTESGWYRNASSTTTGVPVATTSLIVNHINLTTAGAVQIAYRTATSDGGAWMRRKTSGTWQSWSQLYTQGSILGTVSQTSGVPTGAAIQRGTALDANGRVSRLANGWQDVTLNGVTFAYTTSADRINYSWTMPTLATWNAMPHITVTLPSVSNFTGLTENDIGAVRAAPFVDGDFSSILVVLSRVNGATNFGSGDQITNCTIRASGWWY